MTHPAREARQPGTVQVWIDAVLLWCFVTFILAGVTIGAVVSFAVWFLSTPVLGVLWIAGRGSRVGKKAGPG
jgi:hypothetical protein